MNSAKLMATVPPRAVKQQAEGCSPPQPGVDLVEGERGGAEGVYDAAARHRAAGTRDQQDTGETRQRRQPGAPGDAFAKHRAGQQRDEQRRDENQRCRFWRAASSSAPAGRTVLRQPAAAHGRSVARVARDDELTPERGGATVAEHEDAMHHVARPDEERHGEHCRQVFRSGVECREKQRDQGKDNAAQRCAASVIGGDPAVEQTAGFEDGFAGGEADFAVKARAVCERASAAAREDARWP